jgi:peptidoglycan/LPS O-acetylase OafA/YrhL
MHCQFNSRNLETLLIGRNNNFGLIRHLAALLVIYSHGFLLLPDSGQTDIIQLSTKTESSGSLAVFAFFLLSGILVSQSWDRQNSLKHFIAFRFSRIWPALFVCVAFMVFVAAPFFSSLPYLQFISHKETISFFARNISFVTGMRYALPGVFEHNAIQAVNGALWTLPVEVECYCIVLCLGLLQLSKTRVRAMIGVALTLACWLILFQVKPSSSMLKILVLKPKEYTAYPVLFFFCGYFLYHFRHLVVIRPDAAVIMCIVYLLTRSTVGGQIIFYFAFVYLILAISASQYLCKFEPTWDISYGMYVYGFFAQQCFTALFPTQNIYIGMLVSVAATVLFASLSWRFIEKPAMAIMRGWLAEKLPVHPYRQLTQK